MELENAGEDVAEEALGDPATVEPQAGGSRDRAGAQIERHRLPPALGVRSGRGARRRVPQGLRERDRVRLEMLRVSRALDRTHQGAIDESAAGPRRLEDRDDQASHHLAHRYGLTRIAVQLRELAVGLEARELPMPLEQTLLDPRRGDRRLARGPGTRHDHRRAAAEAREGLDRLGCAHAALNCRAGIAGRSRRRRPARGGDLS